MTDAIAKEAFGSKQSTCFLIFSDIYKMNQSDIIIINKVPIHLK